MIDFVEIRVVSGAGGKGVVSFRREKFVPRGGPDGGDGGRGGDVVLRTDLGRSTLAHFRQRKVYRAGNGQPGSGAHRHGSNGGDIVLAVPVGTVVSVAGAEEGWDLDAPETEVVVARGGEGGRGNARFATSVRQAPTFAESGLPGEVRELRLELKLLADAGIVGLPNAGKSTLLRAVSRALPDVGDFAFTTLEPVLGVVEMGLESFVLADLPGLIEGAHRGIGLGHQFLRHAERTLILVHVVDAGAPDPLADHATVRQELELYGHGMGKKREIVVLNKIDIPESRRRLQSLKDAFGPAREVVAASGATREGTRELVARIHRAIVEERAGYQATMSSARRLPVLRPEERRRLSVTEADGEYVVQGAAAQEAALKLGGGGPEAIDELQERLRRLGLERALRRAGARPGDKVRVGRVELEWQG